MIIRDKKTTLRVRYIDFFLSTAINIYGVDVGNGFVNDSCNCKAEIKHDVLL